MVTTTPPTALIGQLCRVFRVFTVRRCGSIRKGLRRNLSKCCTYRAKRSAEVPQKEYIGLGKILTIWSKTPHSYLMSTDGDVLERPSASSGPPTSGDGPPGPTPGGTGPGRPSSGRPGPDGPWVVVLAALFSAAASVVMTELDVPIWSYFLILVLTGGGLFLFFRTKPLRVRGLVLAVLVTVAAIVAGIAGTTWLQNWRCSRGVGRGLEPASKEMFQLTYARGGRDRFGCPDGAAFAREGGIFQLFSGGDSGLGAIAGEHREPPVPVFGPLWRIYESIGGGLADAASLGGIPAERDREGKSTVVYLTDGDCGEGALYKPRPGRPHWVRAEVYEKYARLAGHLGFLGFPVSGPRIEGQNVRQKFEGGVIRVRAEDVTCYLVD